MIEEFALVLEPPGNKKILVRAKFAQRIEHGLSRIWQIDADENELKNPC